MNLQHFLNHHKELNHAQVTSFRQRDEEETHDDAEGKADGQTREEA
jgi:hypothetical protein